jgi:hypothetical protein
MSRVISKAISTWQLIPPPEALSNMCLPSKLITNMIVYRQNIITHVCGSFSYTSQWLIHPEFE